MDKATPHPDDLAVDAWAIAMKAKLAKKRADGRGGWEDKQKCSNEYLSQLLREHVEKGDPLDVANLAMMLHQRGERIGPAQHQPYERVMAPSDFEPKLAEFLEALDQWGCDDNVERAQSILEFQRSGYDLDDYLFEQPDREKSELN